ncbi:hypothetical protein D0V11_24375 [Salmonella enterica]|nr:hypothetical protein [Salmonella enterica]
MIFFRERAGAVFLLFCLSVMSAGSSRQGYAQAPEDLLVGFSSSGEVPADIFLEAEENEKPWLKRPAPRQPVRPHPAENAVAGELKRQIQQLKQKNAGLEKEKQIWQAQKEGDDVRIAGLEKTLEEVRQQYEKALQVQNTSRDPGLVRELAVTRQEIKQLRQAQAQTKSELEKAREQLRVVDEQNRTIRTLTSSLAESRQTLQTFRRQTDTLTGDLKLLREQSTQQETQAAAELKRKQDELATLRQQLAAESEKSRQAEQVLQTLKTENQSREQAARAASENAASQIATLTEQLKAAQKKQVEAQPVKPGSRVQKMAYANGVAFANTLVRTMRLQKELGVDLPQEMILAGFNDAFQRRVQLDTTTMTTLAEALDKELNTRIADRQAREKSAREKQSLTGEKFYRQYAQKKSVRKLHDTLYDIKESGKGAVLMASDQVDILLTGRLPDGTIFDDSGAKNKIQRVRLDSLLPALTEVLTKLRPGGHMEVVLPPSRAFGEEGVPGLIPGNATLVFDIKVLKKV